MKFLEMEFKYKANELSRLQFVKFCKEHGEIKNYTQASGFDYFYCKINDSNSFCRHRVGEDLNQLTFKRKTNDTNNYVRTEHNMNLISSVNVDQVKALCSEFGYEYSSSIFKNCFIYKYVNHTLVYYVCHDENLKELGRFVEIEMAEDYPWFNTTEAWENLLAIEKKMHVLDISAQGRVKKSLFELFGR